MSKRFFKSKKTVDQVLSQHNKIYDLLNALGTYNLQFNIERDKENPNGINLNPMNDVTRETFQLLIDLQESDEARIERRTW